MRRLPASTIILIVLSVVMPIVAGIALVSLRNSLPEEFPVHYGLTGKPDKFVKTTPVRVLSPLILAIGLPLFGLSYLLGFLPRSSGQTSQRSEERTRFNLWFIPVLNLCLSLLYCLMAISPIFPVPGGAGTVIGFVVFIVCFAILGFRHSASLADPGSPRRGDDEHWKAGVIYYNPQDESVFVERRDGLGITINFAHPLGLLMIAFVGIVVILGTY
jgi:Predicted membrane protein